MKLPPWQPIVGDSIVAHESGIHVNGTIRNGSAFEPFPPELVSGTRKIVLGKHSVHPGERMNAGLAPGSPEVQ